MKKMRLIMISIIIMGILTVVFLIYLVTTRVDYVSRHTSIIPNGERFNLLAEATIHTKGIYSVKSVEFTIKISSADGKVS